MVLWVVVVLILNVIVVEFFDLSGVVFEFYVDRIVVFIFSGE